MAKKEDLFLSANKAIDTLLNESERGLAKEFVATLSKIKRVLADAFEKFGTDGILTREEMVKYGRLTKIEQNLVEQIQTLTKNQIRLTKESILTVFEESYYRYGYMIENQSELTIYKMLSSETIDQSLYNELDAIKWDERVKENNNVLVRQLREELTQGLIQGVTYGAIAKVITNRLNIGLNKAKRVIRTEGRRAQSEANLKTMQDASKKGLTTMKRWISSKDSRTRDTHRHLDGTTIEIDEYFVSRSGKKALAPRQFGNNKEDINCRCDMRTVVYVDGEELGAKTMRARNNGDDKRGVVVPYQNYNNWKKDLKKRN